MQVKEGKDGHRGKEREEGEEQNEIKVPKKVRGIDRRGINGIYEKSSQYLCLSEMSSTQQMR